MSESRQGHAGEPALPERDRLYREWILPHLSLNEEDAGRLRAILGIDDLRGFYSLPASREVPLDELAPVDDLRAMPPCLVSKASITIWAPREGAILVPVTDPRGRYNAFQFITPAQLAQWEEKGNPGRFYWWKVPGVSQPVLPDGSDPICAEKGSEHPDIAVITTIPAGVQMISRSWGCSAVQRPDGELGSWKVLQHYLSELLARQVLLFIDDNYKEKELRIWWNLANLLMDSEFEVFFLYPVWQDKRPIPESLDLCGKLVPQAWFREQPIQIQERLAGDSHDAHVQNILELNRKKYITSTRKLMVAFNEMVAEGKRPTFSQVARKAGVAWETARRWFRELGIANTHLLHRELDSGWEPPDLSTMPVAEPASAKRSSARKKKAAAVRVDTELPLFEFAKTSEQTDSGTQEKKEDTASVAADHKPATPPESEQPEVFHTPSMQRPLPPEGEAEVSHPAHDKSEDGTPEHETNETDEVVVEAQTAYSRNQRPLTSVMHTAQTQQERETAEKRQKAAERHLSLKFVAVMVFALALILAILFGRRQTFSGQNIPSTEELETLLPPHELTSPQIRNLTMDEVDEHIRRLNDELKSLPDDEEVPLKP